MRSKWAEKILAIKTQWKRPMLMSRDLQAQWNPNQNLNYVSPRSFTFKTHGTTKMSKNKGSAVLVVSPHLISDYSYMSKRVLLRDYYPLPQAPPTADGNEHREPQLVTEQKIKGWLPGPEHHCRRGSRKIARSSSHAWLQQSSVLGPAR